jgi:drug/metabolite transporter (DMT)-like permease
MDTQPDNSGRNRLVFVGMLVLGVVVAVLSAFLSNSGLLILGLLLALVGGLGWLSSRQ